MKIAAVKFYVSTRKAYMEGVPRLLDILDEHRCKASFYFGMGTEGSGWLNSLIGEKDSIVESSPGIMRDAAGRGHECGICGWNPREWETRLAKIRDTTLEADIRRAVESFTRRTGFRPGGFASPGWQVTYMSLRVADDFRFKYCSDTFGFHPYRPRLSWKTFSTPQIPDTLPPLDALLTNAAGEQALMRTQRLAEQLEPGLSVLSASAVLGTSPEHRELLKGFLQQCGGESVRFVSLATVAASLEPDSLPVREVLFDKPGWAVRPLAIQSIS